MIDEKEKAVRIPPVGADGGQPILCTDQSIAEEVAESKSEIDTALWFDGKNINEALFCSDYLTRHKLIFTGGSFFTVDGRVVDETPLRREIFDELKTCAVTNIPRKISNILKIMKLVALVDDFTPEADRIHVQNGTLYLNGTFTPGKPEIVRNRLPVSYLPEAPAPKRWLAFLNDLLHPEDIPTVQEFIGYCLIPSNKGQRMMIIKGNGGEGKSQIGAVLAALFGCNMKDGIVPEQTWRNVHFKEPTGNYREMFASMEADGTISTRGLKPDADHYCELIFDVNSAYFHNHGGYEFTRQFYADAYRSAIEIVGDEQYILLAVMHADEKNRAMSDALGQYVFHYHLHVVYVPVVEKQILWSKRCKDPALVRTVKEKAAVRSGHRSPCWTSLVNQLCQRTARRFCARPTACCRTPSSTP